MTTRTETATEVFRRIQSGEAIELIDVRTPAEYRAVHAVGARLVPLDSLDPLAVHRDAAGRPLVIICQSGGRAARACERFTAAGVPDAVVVEGGTSAWIAAGLPVIRGKKTMALERQVRIAVGTLVATGVGLSLWVHPAFIALSGFVGLGLVFAGVTDTCAMEMLMARMSWNRVEPRRTARGVRHDFDDARVGVPIIPPHLRGIGHMPDIPDSSNDPRVTLAAERTLLAWVRTGLALMGFGFVVARFGLFLRELRPDAVPASSGSGGSVLIGAGLVGTGVVVNVLAAVGHVRLLRRLDRGERYRPPTVSLAVGVALVVAVLGLLLTARLLITNP
jgi:uncharacterized membrane protein YidH (DUF202 family)/rhodanese-related sulfurtransferase